MRNKRVYNLRQIILKILKECDPAPTTFDYIFEHPNLCMLHTERQEILDEWNYLVKQEFINILPGSGGDYVRISSSGLDQINREGDLDPRIWGAMGL
jgi:hypothetical protein